MVFTTGSKVNFKVVYFKIKMFHLLFTGYFCNVPFDLSKKWIFFSSTPPALKLTLQYTLETEGLRYSIQSEFQKVINFIRFLELINNIRVNFSFLNINSEISYLINFCKN